MSIANGTRFGPYEITGWLGAGGMGEVYRARDLRLERQVAIKLIPERLAADPTRVGRFEQEARAAGQLNHPHLLAVYDIGVHAGVPYIVSELLEGESLRSRLKAGALKPDRVIEYGCQIAEGLAAAHDKSIVHRDIKPDNLFVTSAGRIKILDFGLAKLLQPSDAGASRNGDDTEPGLIMGTAGYMSPEQVRGEQLDARSDIFSVGVVLREMLTGRPPFTRATAADTMAAILKEDPSGDYPPSVSTGLERIVARCLEKSREARFQSARDLAFALEFLSGNLPAALPAHQADQHGAWRGRAIPWMVAGSVLVGLVVSLAHTAPRTGTSRPGALRLVADLGGDAPLAPLNVQYGNAVELSPDGSTIAFVAKVGAEPPRLYIRGLNQTRATALPGTEDAISPFFSPDGKWVGFFANTKLKKIASTGGAPIVVADAMSSRGGSWAPDDSIVFQADNTPGRPLLRVSADGGKAEELTALAAGEATQAWPQILPGGGGLIYTSTPVANAYNDANVVGRSLPDGAPRVIQRGAYHARYLPSGHLVYVHNGTLFAAPFDPARLEITGTPVAVLEGLMANGITGGAQFSVSDTGTLVYLPGQSTGGGIRLEWMDRLGKTTTLRAGLANWFTPVVSPDGGRLAMEIREGSESHVWIYEPARDTMTRLTTTPAHDSRPVWTPDGRRIAFATDGESVAQASNLYWASADGSGTPERLTTSQNAQQPASWDPTGRFLAFEEMSPITKMDVMILRVERSDGSGWRVGPVRAFASSPKMEWDPAFSPDGRWLAYASLESPGNREVFVQPFPGPGARVQISEGGGSSPVWSRTRPELLYGRDGQIMVISYTTDAGVFRVSKPEVWSPGRFQTRGELRMFDLHPDGQRVALAPAAESPTGGRQDRAVFVFNFFNELERISPTSKR